MGCGRRRAGSADHFCSLLNRERRGDLLLVLGPLALYALNQQVKTRVTVRVLGDLLRCHANDYLGGIAFAAYLNLILSLSRVAGEAAQAPRRACSPGPVVRPVLGVYCPLFLPDSVGDPLDVVAYVLGTLSYWLLWGRRTPV